jgi:hypothetical protein
VATEAADGCNHRTEIIKPTLTPCMARNARNVDIHGRVKRSVVGFPADPRAIEVPQAPRLPGSGSYRSQRRQQLRLASGDLGIRRSSLDLEEQLDHLRPESLQPGGGAPYFVLPGCDVNASRYDFIATQHDVQGFAA